MFSGIVEATGTVVRIEQDRSNVHFTLSAPFAGELTIDQSVAHNGVCLTVVALYVTKRAQTASTNGTSSSTLL